eukprot:TRINITY_DN6452_c0_g1_i1.p1 TRINITY_DN6452_c0_g1~~TRINITY_DN6452_c0_g1_i1.p1  ORF type:complete len:327 (+),score=52.08 TRINITY_DN6452_c0_g1_i1:28-981(+)
MPVFRWTAVAALLIASTHCLPDARVPTAVPTPTLAVTTPAASRGSIPTAAAHTRRALRVSAADGDDQASHTTPPAPPPPHHLLLATALLCGILAILQKALRSQATPEGPISITLLGVTGHRKDGSSLALPSRARLSPRSGRSSLVALAANDRNTDPPGNEGKWAAAGIDESSERLESLKAAGLAAVVGSVAAAGPGLLVAGLGAQWEFDVDMLALSSALFGVVYRYAVRTDPNPNLRQGVVGAFALVRTVAAIRVPATCTPFPLSCGPPLEYFNWDMLQQAVGAALPAFAAFGAAAVGLEVAMARGWIRQFGAPPSR